MSPDEPRLRTGWRLLLHTILLFVFGIIISIVTGFIGFLDEPLASILNQILNFIVITGSVYVAHRWLDKRSFESLGLKLFFSFVLLAKYSIGIRSPTSLLLHLSTTTNPPLCNSQTNNLQMPRN